MVDARTQIRGTRLVCSLPIRTHRHLCVSFRLVSHRDAKHAPVDVGVSQVCTAQKEKTNKHFDDNMGHV